VIVVDTSVVAYLLLPGPQTEKAEALLLHDPEWAAPVLWRSELRNVLSCYLRRGQLDHQQVLRLQGQAEALLHGWRRAAAAPTTASSWRPPWHSRPA